jgi:hypothetical protein
LESWKKISNPKELINVSCRLSANLARVWASGIIAKNKRFKMCCFLKDYYLIRKLSIIAPPEVNRVVALIANLSKDLEQIKKPDFSNFEEKSGSVPPPRPNMNEIIEATRDLAHIWDLYGHLIAKSIST